MSSDSDDSSEDEDEKRRRAELLSRQAAPAMTHTAAVELKPDATYDEFVRRCAKPRAVCVVHGWLARHRRGCAGCKWLAASCGRLRVLGSQLAPANATVWPLSPNRRMRATFEPEQLGRTCGRMRVKLATCAKQ